MLVFCSRRHTDDPMTWYDPFCMFLFHGCRIKWGASRKLLDKDLTVYLVYFLLNRSQRCVFMKRFSSFLTTQAIFVTIQCLLYLWTVIELKRKNVFCDRLLKATLCVCPKCIYFCTNWRYSVQVIIHERFFIFRQITHFRQWSIVKTDFH